jgi:drug/metabolite transporter (DMT)-like permease
VTGVALALCASLAWGVADFGAGFSTRRLPVFVVALVLQTAGLVVAGVALLAAGESVPSSRQLAWAALAGLAGVVGLSSFYQGLAVGRMGIVGPISSCAALVPFAYGLARGERPATHQLVGALLAIVGIVAASLEPGAEGRGRRVGVGVGFALVAVLGFGTSLIGLSEAAPGGVVWATLVMRVVAVPCLLALVLAFGRARPTRVLWPILIGAGVFDTVATFLYAAATTHGLLSVVSVLASLYPVVLVVLARVVLHERVARPQLVGVAIVLAGVALVSA